MSEIMLTAFAGCMSAVCRSSSKAAEPPLSSLMQAREAFLKMIGSLESVDAGAGMHGVDALHELEERTIAISHASLLDADDPVDGM